MLGRAILLAERFHALDLKVRLRQQAEIVRQFLLDVGDLCAGIIDIGLAACIRVGIQELLVAVDEAEEGIQVTLEAHLVLQRGHLALDALHFLQAQLMDLVGGHVGGGHLAQLILVVRLAVLVRRAHARGIHGGIRQIFLRPGNYAFVGGLELFQQGLFRFFLQFGCTLGADLAALHQGIGLGLRIRPYGRVRPSRERRTGNDLA